MRRDARLVKDHGSVWQISFKNSILFTFKHTHLRKKYYQKKWKVQDIVPKVDRSHIGNGEPKNWGVQTLNSGTFSLTCGHSENASERNTSAILCNFWITKASPSLYHEWVHVKEILPHHLFATQQADWDRITGTAELFRALIRKPSPHLNHNCRRQSTWKPRNEYLNTSGSSTYLDTET